MAYSHLYGVPLRQTFGVKSRRRFDGRSRCLSIAAIAIEVDTYNLASATSVSRILASGAGMETMVVPVGESDEKGSATDL